ncbi:MAG: 23S rRNA (adenine(2503)-C(2))-methyltransferase RlmN [Bacteroidales bacterium]|nr:23S rRNA (adenine(2503)-C(2))-methyltransferase RlmN [Bacteroidales bacterium]MBR6278712.1 23S rRNA (adenine(2503)-C(2))-methyltransferase RlmN [Bacteroidales bacterium]
MEKDFLFGKTLAELQETVLGLGLPKFTAKQLADWLYKKDITEFDQMTNLSKKARALLEEKFVVGLSAPVKETVSKDGTKKYLFSSGENRFVEAAYIPDKDRATLCLSCQTGCKMGCKFCNTGLQGFAGNLNVNQILNQIKSLPEKDNLTNLVFMGMGEPMDNLQNIMKALEILTSDYGFAMSPHRITLSTVGIMPALKEFLDKTDVHLAVSVHNPFAKERAEIMPIEKAQPLERALMEIEKHDFRHQRRFSAEYIMIQGFNDTPTHARKLAEILKNIPSRVNLIRYHEHPGSDFKSSSEIRIREFQEILNSKNIITTIRASRGEDIFAACGLLSTKEMKK